MAGSTSSGISWLAVLDRQDPVQVLARAERTITAPTEAMVVVAVVDMVALAVTAEAVRSDLVDMVAWAVAAGQASRWRCLHGAVPAAAAAPAINAAAFNFLAAGVAVILGSLLGTTQSVIRTSTRGFRSFFATLPLSEAFHTRNLITRLSRDQLEDRFAIWQPVKSRFPQPVSLMEVAQTAQRHRMIKKAVSGAVLEQGSSCSARQE
jgi:hypothetical protein